MSSGAPTSREYLNERLEGMSKKPVVVNLASEEYFRSVDLKTLKARVVQCVFQDWKNGAYKIISFNAKRARGLMARYAIQHKTATPERLKVSMAKAMAADEAASRRTSWCFAASSA